jgi:hypothetical protein
MGALLPAVGLGAKVKVRMLVQVSGTRDGRDWPVRGSVVELPDAEAAQYCRAGMAEPVAVFDDIETATLPEPEQRGLTTSTGPAKRSKR